MSLVPACRAVLFDLDGTLTPVPSVWQHIHEVLGQWQAEARRHQEEFLRGAIDYQEFCVRDAAHWKGMAESKLRAITDVIPYRAGAKECVEALKGRGLVIGVISTGLTLLVERVHNELDLAYAIGNRLVARHGILTGDVKINVEHGRKGEAVDLFCTQFGVDYREVVTVGDSDGDISMFEHSGYSIAFNPATDTTARSASVVCRGESLQTVWEHLEPMLPAVH